MTNNLPTVKKIQALEKRMHLLNIKESDIQEQFILGSGKGGQAVNKTHNAVLLKHIPSGICIKSQKSRSRELNRFYARRQLCDALELKKTGIVQYKQDNASKLKKQKSRRKRRSSSRIVRVEGNE
ncbi:peptide chain release factor-like protein [Candidatus Marinamargulisbacteria bacterium SCGC AG-410-N11]|nr:peptide chain release factor-like protein [Candidatus Marinamargulisbacteria bacterium SCGC AG-410-N11]